MHTSDKKTNTDRKNVLWNAIGSTANAFISLVFTVVVTRINGVDKAGVFSYGFAFACMLYAVGTYIIRAFQVTDLSDEFTDSDYIYNRVTSCIFMILLAVGFVLINRYSWYKSSIILSLCLFKCVEAFGEVIYGVLQKNGRLWQVGISLLCKAATAVVLFITVDLFTKNLLISCVMIILAYSSYMIIYDLGRFKKVTVTKSKFSFSKNMSIFKAGFYTFLIMVLCIYLINAPRYAIDSMMDNETQTVYGIIILPATFMSLLAHYIIQPFLTSISQSIKNVQVDRLRKSILSICAVMILLGVFVFIIAFLLEEPVLSFIYGLDLKEYKIQMLLIIFGSVFYGFEAIFSHILIAFRKTGVQAMVFVIVSILALVLSNRMVYYKGIEGAAITYVIVMALLAVSFGVYLLYIFRKFALGAKQTEGEKG